jgi:hypothetical protein
MLVPSASAAAKLRVRSCGLLAVPASLLYFPGMSIAARASDLDPVLAALDAAPVVRWLTPEQRADLDEAMAEIAAGRVELVEHDDVPAWLEQHAGSRP